MEPQVGRRIRRLEDRRYLTGSASYVDDLQLPGMLYAAFVRSPHAHARLVSIDPSAALRLPGVVAVATAADLNPVTAPLRLAPPIEGLLPTEQACLPADKVRYVGDLVACVVATDRYVARDAADLVAVEYEPLPAVNEMTTADAPGTPAVDPDVPRNVVCEQAFSAGDPDGALAAADAVVRVSFRQGRQTHLPLEPRGCLASWHPGDETITLWASTQIPHPLRSALAARLKVPENRCRVVTPDVGGGFGQKIPLFREELATCALSRRLGRPIKWIETRQENLLASLHAREDLVTVEAGVRRDGTLLALKAHILSDFGAYCFFPANYMSAVVGMLLPGPYKLADYAYSLKTVLTNKAPAGPMRAPMLVCSWVTEGTIEAIARRLELDPHEVRRRNLIRAEDQPYLSATGQRYEAVSALESLDRAAELIGYAELRAEQARARAAGRLVGLGTCTYVEPTAYGSVFYRAAGIPGSGHDVATVKIDPSGAVWAQLGIVSQGQGHATTMAQVVADVFGLAPDEIRVLAGDTAAAPYSMGTRGSRGAVVGAGSMLAAAGALRDKLVRIAAHRLEVAPDEIQVADGRFFPRGAPNRGLALADLARTAYLAPMELPPGMEPGLEANRAYDPPPLTYANATHCCTVEIDPQTGRLTIGRYVVVEDSGTLINPTIVEGQTHGAVAMGLSGALLEQMVYDADGQCLTASLLDYALATATAVPSLEIEHLTTPNPHTPLGLKGMSEGGTMGASAAICNAVADALAPLGLAVDRQPLTPDRIFALLRRANEPA